MEKEPNYVKWSIIAAISMGLIVVAFMVVMPLYNVWSKEQNGKAQLAEAEYSKQVAVQQAKAKNDSAQYEADAEVTRAGGVKKANDIIKESLGGSEGYLRYLYIDALKNIEEKGGQIIYVPTEGGLPILEAGRLDANANK